MTRQPVPVCAICAGELDIPLNPLCSACHQRTSPVIHVATCKSCGDEYQIVASHPRPDSCEKCAEFYRASGSSVGVPFNPADRYLTAVKRLFGRAPTSSPVGALRMVAKHGGLTLEELAGLGPSATSELIEKYLEEKGPI